MRTIAIVGGGFSGTALTAHLLRTLPACQARVVLIERRAQLGRGVAYAARGHEYLLNVPAGKMSAFSTEPSQFVDFARDVDPSACADCFLPRQVYGNYLQHVLLRSELAAPHGVQLETLRVGATAITRSARSNLLHVRLADGGVVAADDVVLACGNPPPRDPVCTAALAGHPRYVRDACSENQPCYSGNVLLIGAGLTMADTVLAAARDPTVVLHAISRHGLMPMAQAALEPGAPHRCIDEELIASATSLRTLLRATRRLAGATHRDGGDWRTVVDAVRRVAPTLWRLLDDRDRRRFLRHLRSYWDLHRHRLPPQTAARLVELRAAGRLRLRAGRIRELEPRGAGIRVYWQARSETATRTLDVDWVVNCTGPDYDLRRSTDPLFQRALTSGLATADRSGLGLRTGTHGTVIGAAGTPAEHLFYLGPMLRPAHWETTAVPELRGHAERLAAHLAHRTVNGLRN